MYLLFIDESGNPPKNTTHFILGGIIIPEEMWFQIDDKIKNIKKIHNIKGEIKWRHFFNGNKAGNPLSHLSNEDREKIRLDLFKIISDIKALTIISTVSIISQLESKTDEEIYHDAYKSLCERFQYFLQDIKRNTGTMKRGIIIADNRSQDQDKKLKLYHKSTVQKIDNNNQTNFKNIIENLFIANSDLSTGLQLSEMACGAIARYYQRNDDKYIKLIKNNIRKCSKTGKIEGFGIIKRPK